MDEIQVQPRDIRDRDPALIHHHSFVVLGAVLPQLWRVGGKFTRGCVVSCVTISPIKHVRIAQSCSHTLHLWKRRQLHEDVQYPLLDTPLLTPDSIVLIDLDKEHNGVLSCLSFPN